METLASDGPTVASSPASTSSTSDNDAVNSSTARIYFGPTQSPEKKFAYAVGSNVFSNGSLVRRSTRLPVATPLAIRCEDIPAEDSDTYQEASSRGKEGENEMEEGADGQSRSNTPENEQNIPDEPSSILADRIIHALDNPSPPPQTQDLPEHVFPPLDSSEICLADISGSPIHSPEAPEPEYAIQVTTLSDMLPPLLLLDRSANLPLLTVRDSSLEPEAGTLHQDLISFKRNPEPSTSVHINIDAPTPEASNPSPHISRAQIPTVDDLLHSPIPSLGRKRRSLSPLAEGHDGTAEGSQPVRRSARLSIARSIESPLSSPSVVRKRKQESVDASTNSDTMGFPENVTLSSAQLPSLTLEPDGSLEKRGGMGPLDHAQNHGEDVPQTTPRVARQSPRRSLTPRAFGKSKEPFPLTGTIVDKKQWKGKGRAFSPALEAVSDPTDDATTGGITDSQSPNLDVPSSEIGIAEQGVVSSETMRRRKSMPAKTQDEEERELRSLSPDSSDVLMQLFPQHRDSRSRSKSPTVKQATVQITSQPEEPPPRTPPPPSSFPTQRPNASNFPSSIKRPTVLYSPKRQGIALLSPSKYAARVLDDPNRTPARRVPLEQVLTEGTLSPERASQLTLKPSTQAGPSRSPVFKKSAIDDSTRTLAQRIPISEAMRTNQAQKYRSPVREVVRASGTTRFSSPVRGESVDRTLHGAIRPPERHTSRERSRSVDLPPSILVHSASSSTRPTPQLPFPLVARGAKSDLPSSIPEETELGPVPQSPRRYIASSAQPAATDSPAKTSRLRQPTIASRIPRIGAKPYARPPSAKSKAPAVAQKPAGHGNANLNLLRTGSGSGSGSSSDDLSMKTTGSSTAITTHVKSAADSASSSFLKRKRSPETKVSPSKKQPHMLMLRQVVPGMLDAKYAPKAPPASTRGVEPDSAGELLKQIQPTGRKVVDGIIHRNLNQEYAKNQTNTGGDVAEQTQALDMAPAESPDASAKEHVTSGSSMLCDQDNSPVPPITPATKLPVSGDISITSETTESLGNVRRTTRARKQTQIADVFGTVAPQPTQPRRRAAASRSEPVFAGLSAIALRALTSSNTTKNQHYVAAKLETEVVRKEGDRPESPVVKVRTISQREKDEKLRERQERAERRARRGDKDPGGSSDNEGISDRGNSSAVEAEEDSDAEEFSLRYRMGPGDEEEYTTPDNKIGSAKRARLTEVEVERDSKRVKWDRGLSTMIYLDDLEPKPRKPPKDEVLKKGCLSRSAKSLHLDSLGNLLNADTPLPDLVHQSIVVKKFVYDNDVQPHSPIAKATRSKSKKAKG